MRINLGNRVEPMTLPGIGRERADAIIRWRAEHGPIASEAQLPQVLGGWPLPEGIGDRIDFAPAAPAAPEAPGA